MSAARRASLRKASHVLPFEPFNRLKHCRYGQMLYNKNDTLIGRSLDRYGEYSEGEVELFRQVLQPGNVVVEVGASIGAHTVFMAQQVTRSGIVFAFEPQRILFQTLCANLALNNITNVYCLPNAIGSKPGPLIIPTLDYTQENNFSGLALGSFQNGEGVPQTPLDAFNIPACHFLKIDVEGMEIDVLEGASKLISRFKPVIYIGNDRHHRMAELIRYLAGLSYNLYWHRRPYFNPQNFLGNSENVFGDLLSTNLVCIHSTLPQQVAGLPPVEVPPA
jgi:FkbM family methyltransferase